MTDGRIAPAGPRRTDVKKGIALHEDIAPGACESGPLHGREAFLGYYLEKLAAPGAKVFLQFGGQGNTYMRDLTKLFKDYPSLARYFDTCFDSIAEELVPGKPLYGSPILEHGFELHKWVRGENLPPEKYLFTCTVSLTAIHITQYAYYHLLEQEGALPEAVIDKVVGGTGHSQGIHSACLASMRLKGDDFYEALRRYAKFYLYAGHVCQEIYPIRKLPAEILALSEKLDYGPPAPMVSVAGLTVDELQALLDEYNTEIPDEYALTITLVNTPTALIVSGREEDLVRLRERHYDMLQKREAGWSYLEITAPFHSHFMLSGSKKVAGYLNDVDFDFKGADLTFPVYSTHDGRNMQELGKIGEFQYLLQASQSLDWSKSIAPVLEDDDIGYVVDFGPGLISTLFTRELLKAKPGRDPEIIAVATRSGLKKCLKQE